MEKPELLTFDIFGTVLNWFDGLQDSVQSIGATIDRAAFDRIIDQQGKDEQKQFKSYTEITANSLTEVLGINFSDGMKIAQQIGHWPIFSDSAQGLRDLMRIAPCVAMSNSDRVHGEQVQRQLGYRLSHWFCAEDVRVYKPNPEFWNIVSRKTEIPFSKKWWHVSAYADYDLTVAKQLGLTCIFVDRKHNRPGSADLVVQDLRSLASIAAQMKSVF